MKIYKLKKTIFLTSFILAVFIIFFIGSDATAKSKVKLSNKKISMEIGGQRTLKIKGTTKTVKWSVITGKKVVKLSAKKKSSVKIKAKKKGNAKIQAKVGKKKYICKIVVTKKKDKTPKADDDVINDEQPSDNSDNSDNNAVTTVANLQETAHMKIGEQITLKLTGNAYSVIWYTNNYGYISIDEHGNDYVTLTALNSGVVELVARIDGTERICTITIDEIYNYEITPFPPPFNQFFFLKTDDPEPHDLQFLDERSVYYKDDDKPMAIVPVYKEYADVVYQDKDKRRVNGGYICWAGGVFNHGDGGELTMKRKVASEDHHLREYIIEDDVKGVSSSSYYDTTVKIKCAPVKSYAQYLVDEYAEDGKTLFDNLDVIEGKLSSIALYPRFVMDENRPNKETPYPFLAASVYQELGINIHLDEMYYWTSLLAQDLYPFTLSSSGFPGTMWEAAELIDPSCSVKSGSVHWNIEVTKDGITQVYGGSGGGGNDPILSKHADKVFLFDGTKEDMAANASLDWLYNKLFQYGDAARDDAEFYNDLLHGDTFNEKIGKGSWCRIAKEGYGGGQKPRQVYTYMARRFSYAPAYSYYDVWVDGRYVNDYNYWEQGAKFSDHPTADIILTDQTYTTKNGDVKNGDIIYFYQHDKGCWEAMNTWVDDAAYNPDWELPEQFILTKEEVQAMTLDYNTDTAPEHGLIYDSSVYPGTPF